MRFISELNKLIWAISHYKEACDCKKFKEDVLSMSKHISYTAMIKLPSPINDDSDLPQSIIDMCHKEINSSVKDYIIIEWQKVSEATVEVEASIIVM